MLRRLIIAFIVVTPVVTTIMKRQLLPVKGKTGDQDGTQLAIRSVQLAVFPGSVPCAAHEV